MLHTRVVRKVRVIIHDCKKKFYFIKLSFFEEGKCYIYVIYLFIINILFS